MITGYADEALRLGKYGEERVCRKIAKKAPESFREALQLVWLAEESFFAEGRSAMALGRIIGSSQYSISDVREYLEFLSENENLQNKIRSLATCYKVEEINKAFADIKARKNIKTVLVGDKND